MAYTDSLLVIPAAVRSFSANVIASGEVSEQLRAEGEGVCGFVEAKTPLGRGTLPIVGPLRVEVGGRECKAFAALTESSFDGYELILQNTMFGGEKGRKI